MEKILEVGKKYSEVTGIFADAFVDELQRMSASPEITALVIDLKGTLLISSLAISAIFSVYKDFANRNKVVRIINPSPRTVNVIKMLNMGAMLN
ncbi:MAG: STAS domain-containing protein [Planctomycetota bacterium]|nr:STAS domain-containing protein [Planctomycetota bacterium]